MSSSPTMHPNKSTSASTNKSVAAGEEVAVDLYPYIRQFKDGRVERFVRTSFVPASEDPAASGSGVATRDVVIDRTTGVSARLFLPAGAAATGHGSRLLPIVMYIRGGTFCTESAFSRMYHRYGTSLAARAGALVVSVDYRLAPEHPVPAAYDDAWTALQWVASMSDHWLANHGDPKRIFIAGDSAGGNITYHTAVRASRGGVDLEVEGVLLVHPYFWGDKQLLPSEAVHDGIAMFTPEFVNMVWPFVTAGQAGNDDPRLNPPDEEIASLRCRRALVAVASKDIFRHRGCRVAARMRDSPWIGDNVTLVVSEGEDHTFHLYGRPRPVTERLMESIVQFINQPPTIAREGNKTSTTTSEADHSARPDILGAAATRPFNNTLGTNGMQMKLGSETRYMVRSLL